MMSTEPWLSEIVELQRSGELEQALARVESVLAESPDLPLALFLRGCVRAAQEDAEGAVRDWETACSHDPELAMKLAEELPAVVEAAFYSLGVEAQVGADNPAVLGALGRAYRLFGRYPEAAQFFTRAVEINPRAEQDGVLAAEIFQAQGQPEHALQVLVRLLEFREDSPELHFQVGRLHQQLGSTALALRHLERAVALQSDDPRPRLLLGEIYTVQGRFDQGEVQLQRCLQLSPTARAYLGLAECVRGQYRFDEALDYLKKAVEVEPDNVRALTELGNLALQFGDLDLGVQSLKRALALRPDQADVYALLARAAQQQGDEAQAIEAYQQLLELTPNDPGAWHNLGNLLRGRRNWVEAVQALERAQRILERDPQICLDLADCYVQLDRAPEATALLRSTYLRHPNHNEVKSALQQLDPDAVPEDKTSHFLTAPREEVNPWLQDVDPIEFEIVPLVQEEPAPAIEEPAQEVSGAEKREQARELEAAGRHQEALDIYQAALKQEPSDRECLRASARLQRELGRLGAACASLRKVFAADPSDFEVFPELLAVLVQADEMDRDESLAGVILAIPAQFDRRGFLNLLWSLRAGEQTNELIDIIAQGLFSRFPSDLECRRHWEQLQAGASAAALPTEEENDSSGPEASPESPAESPEGVSEAAPEIAAEAPAPVLETTLPEPPPVEEPEQPREAAGVPEPSFPEEAAPEPETAEEPAPELEIVAEEAPSPEPVAPLLEPDAPAQTSGREPAPELEIATEEPLPPEPTAPFLEPAAPVETEQPVLEIAASEPLPADFEAEAEPAPVTPADPEPAPLAEPAPELEAQPEEALPEPVPSIHWEVEAPIQPEGELLSRWLFKPASPDPEGAALYRELAGKLRERGHLQEACLAMGQALQREPERGGEWLSHTLCAWAEELEQSGEEASLVTVCRSWVQLFPQDQRVLDRLAVLDPDSLPEPPPAPFVVPDPLSLTEGLEWLRQHPGHALLLERVLELGRGHDEEVLGFFRLLTKDSLADPLHIRNFARVYLSQQKPILAVVQYQKYLMAAPSAEGYRELAAVYTQLNREKNANEALKKAEELSAG